MKSYLFAFLCFFLPAIVQGSEPMWVDLFPPGARETIDSNGGVISECMKGDHQKWDSCRKIGKYKLTEWIYDLYEGPSEKSKKMGQFIIALSLRDQETPILAFYKPLNSEMRIEFVPEEVNAYGGDRPYFDFSILEKKGDWVRLPKNPYPSPVWMKLPEYARDKSRIKTLKLEQFYILSKDETITPLKIEKNALRYRKFNKNDMLCGDDPVEVRPSELVEKIVPFKDLYDKDGHLTIKVAFRMGC